MKNNKERYISSDIEASGPIPGPYSMISLGACAYDDTRLTFYRELQPISRLFEIEAMKVATQGLLCTKGLKDPVYDPLSPSFQPAKVLEVLSQKGDQPAYAMRDFEKWVIETASDKKPVLVAFGTPYDWMFIHWYFHSFLGKNPFGINGPDIKAYYMGKFDTTWGDTRKRNMPRRFLPETPHTHNALEDAIEQAEIWRRIRDAPRK